jgi:hypothetical protein
MKRTVTAILAGMLSVPALALPISDVPTLPAADRTAVSALEQTFFNGVEIGGAEKTLVELFAAMGESEAMTVQARATLKAVDENCGKLRSIERVRTESFGTMVAMDHFVASYDACQILWKLTYARPSGRWQFWGYNLVTLKGNEWTY